MKLITVKIGTDWDIKLHGLQTRIFDNHGFASEQATIKFIDEIKKLNPDVIHLHNIHGYYINIEILFNYLKTCNKKIIWTLHDCWSFTGHCAHFDFVINCVGILNEYAEKNPDIAIYVNGYFPHYLDRISNKYNFKLIHITTDCVFSGKKGNYIENDFRDAISYYGRREAMGEVDNNQH